MVILATTGWAATVELRADVVTTDPQTQTVTARGRVRITNGAAVAQAERAVYAPTAGRLVLTDNVTITGSEGELRAQSATILLGKSGSLVAMIVTGSVRLSSHGRRLTADRVDYGAASRTATATGTVSVMAPPDLVISGQELVVNLAQRVATVGGRSRVQNADGVIEADHFELIEQTQTATFRGQVIATFRGTRLTADSATLDNKAQLAVFRGRVTVTSPGRALNAEQVTVFYRQGRLVAEGHISVRVEQERP